jgi:chromosome segregation ATPase
MVAAGLPPISHYFATLVLVSKPPAASNDARAAVDKEAEERAKRFAEDTKKLKKADRTAALEEVSAELRRMRQRRDDLLREQEQLQAEVRMADSTIRQCRSELNETQTAVTQAENTLSAKQEQVEALDKRLMSIMSDQGNVEDAVRAELAEEQSKAVVAAIGATVNKCVVPVL